MLVKVDPPHPRKQHKTIVWQLNVTVLIKRAGICRIPWRNVEEQWNCAQLTQHLFKRIHWVGNLFLSQKFGNFFRGNATFSRLLFVVFQYQQTRSLCPYRHGTVWCTFLLDKYCAQTWPPWRKFASPFHANGFIFSSENLSDISQYHTLFKTCLLYTSPSPRD